MPTTTVTTGSPSDAGPGELTIRQRVSSPSVAEAVQERLRELYARGERRFNPAQFDDLAPVLRRPVSWITDQLLILEGLGVLRPDPHSSGRLWTLAPDAECRL